jgi:hypothetical protein
MLWRTWLIYMQQKWCNQSKRVNSHSDTGNSRLFLGVSLLPW